MRTHICLFEDTAYVNLLPLVHLRPVYALRCGILTLAEKAQLQLADATFTYHTRDYLAPLVREMFDSAPVNRLPADQCLFVNGRLLCDRSIAGRLLRLPKDCMLVSNGSLVAIHLSGEPLKALADRLADYLFDIDDFTGVDAEEVDAQLATHPWDLFAWNGTQIEEDYSNITPSLNGRRNAVRTPEGVHMFNDGAVYVAEGVDLMPGVVLDARNGPIFVDRNAMFYPHCAVEGPAYIGRDTVLKMHAKIYAETSIGPVCKVGGEVIGAVMHGYANKQHEGFLGHAYVCPWINLGAGTNNSDLKNNYGSVEMSVNGEMVDTGLSNAGLVMADHAKTSINSTFNTGTVVGVGCNVFGAGFPPKHIPSFSWGGADGFTTYDLDKCLQVARVVMKRRNIEMTPAYEDAMRHVFELTEEERAPVAG